MDRLDSQPPVALTPEGHEQSFSHGEGKLRNYGYYHYQDGP